MLTRITNVVEQRRLPYIIPNGRVLNFGETVIIPGAIETELYLSKNSDVHDEYIFDLVNNRIVVTTEGFGGGAGADPVFSSTIGDGVNTLFQIDAGFATAGATVLIYDTISGSILQTVQITLESPNAASVELEFTPAPASGQIAIFIFAA